MRADKKNEITFGTDGWRAIIAREFTFANVRRVSLAFGQYCRKNAARTRPEVAVGFDNRFLSKEFAAVFAAGLAQYGIKVRLFKNPIPTPALSFTILNGNFFGGVMITASHNPYVYNGIKIKTADGISAGVDLTLAIERLIARPVGITKKNRGKITFLPGIDAYIKNMEKFLIPGVFRGSRLKIINDEMYGTQNSLIAGILTKHGMLVQSIHSQRDPFFGGVNPEPISQNLRELSAAIKQRGFDLGLATDGDADRIGAVGPDGACLTSHQIIALLTLHLLKNRNWRGAIAKTINTTVWLDKIAGAYGLKIYETPVGFKHLSALLKGGDVLIAGEESGGIGFKNYIYERDGILAGLLLVEMLCVENRGINRILRDLENKYGRFYYYREDLRFSGRGNIPGQQKLKKIKKILRHTVRKTQDYDGIKFTLNDDSWLLLRFSGTEPLVRIYAEGRSRAEAGKLVEYGKNLLWN